MRANSLLVAACLILLSTCGQTSGDEPPRGPDAGAKRPGVRSRLRDWWLHRTGTRIQPTNPAPLTRQPAPLDTATVQSPILPASLTTRFQAEGTGAKNVLDPATTTVAGYLDATLLGELGEDTDFAQAPAQRPGSTTPRTPSVPSGVPAQGTAGPGSARPSAPSAPASGVGRVPGVGPVPGATAAPATPALPGSTSNQPGLTVAAQPQPAWRGNAPARTEVDCPKTYLTYKLLSRRPCSATWSTLTVFQRLRSVHQASVPPPFPPKPS